MIFTCNVCNAQYKISDDRIPPKGAKVKCKRCGNIITIKPPEMEMVAEDSSQNEATVVQRSPFEDENIPPSDSTRVISQEQAAGIFKSLINEHSQEYQKEEDSLSQANEEESISDQDQPSQEYQTENQASLDDRPTSVYEDKTSFEEDEQIDDETEQNNDNMSYEENGEEDISREATRVVSTDQLKQLVGNDEVEKEESSRDQFQNVSYPQQAQPFVSPRSRGEWYVAIGQMQVGPLSMNEVEEKWGRGELNSTTLVWKAGMTGWQPLMYVPELSHLVPPMQEVKEEQPPVREFKPEINHKEEATEPISSSTFPSLDDLTKQEEELQSQKEERSPLDWKPAAGEALASLVQDEMESMQRGFSTDIPIVPRIEEKINTSSAPESNVLPLEKPVESAIPSPVVQQNISTPPVVVEQPAVPTPTPYSGPYPDAYPNIYSQPPQKPQKSRMIPILIAIFGAVLIIGSALAYIIFKQLSDEKTIPQNQVVKSQQPQQPAQQPQLQQQPQQVQPQQPQQVQNVEEQKKKEESIKAEETKKEEVAKVEEKNKKIRDEERQEVQRKKVVQKEKRGESSDKQPANKMVSKVEEKMPPPPKMNKTPKAERVAQEETPPKKKASKGGDALLDFEGEQNQRGGGYGGLPKTLAQEQILEVVKANIGRIKTCMAEQAKRDASIKGKLIIGWEIQPNGKTKNVKIKSPQFKGTYIGTCISSVVMDFTFPKFSGPPIPIEFPFNIK